MVIQQDLTQSTAIISSHINNIKASEHNTLNAHNCFQRLLTTNNMAVVPHPPYSPDVAHCDFFLFPKIKMTLGWRFNDVEEIQAESQAALDAVQKKEFHKCFQKWENRCIAAQGEYFEGDNFN
jgi:hypothetical protein